MGSSVRDVVDPTQLLHEQRNSIHRDLRRGKECQERKLEFLACLNAYDLVLRNYVRIIKRVRCTVLFNFHCIIWKMKHEPYY
jgi:hypothetical protein